MKNISFVVVVLLVAVGLAAAEIKNKGWWKNAVFYQVYPRSLKDSDGDGIGDLKGITSKLQHFNSTGVTAIWLSPINKSPMNDFGYDISDFRDVAPVFGTLKDLENLLAEAHKIGLKVILDLVPNHTSDQHLWFQKSVNNTKQYADYYIWVNGTGENGTSPPNNWVSVFNGSAWTYHKQRKQLYFHQFLASQPDLNYRNPVVQREMKDIMKFWLDKGIDGFRIDAVPHLFELNDITKNEPKLEHVDPSLNETHHAYYDHIYTKDQNETYQLVQSWRNFVDEYAEKNGRDEIVLLTEAYTSLSNTIKYYNYGSHVPFNFKFITDADANSNATQLKNVIDSWINKMPQNAVANWVMGNHDRVRLGSRYPDRADQMIMLEMILPGVAVTYYGEEIGMVDIPEIKYDVRDGCRSPFQWDNTTSAGFSNTTKTWLPVNKNFKDVNLQKEEKEKNSPYQLYTKLIDLRKEHVLKHGSLITKDISKYVLAVLRENETETVSLLINISNNKTSVKLTQLGSTRVSENPTKILLGSTNFNQQPGTQVNNSIIELPGHAAVILISSGASLASYSVISLLLAVLFSLFPW
ncbi:alpha glucosidase 2 [Bombus vancouverensis nearcticus]|uniref:alpha glucosidase 2 n=1 Tax=Bombus vancouverensis nearcticus TaxID=2705178 RepID=UPI00402B1ABC